MDNEKLRQLLTAVQAGKLNVPEALGRLRNLPYEDLGFARLDTHRSLRQGVPEIVFGENKSVQQLVEILERLFSHHDRVLATRVTPEAASAVKARLPAANYDAVSRLLILARTGTAVPAGDAPYTVVVSGGTADLPVAEEAAQLLEFLGCQVRRCYDVGVAGIHRLLDQRTLLDGAAVIISVAGMEGALTSVVGGLVRCPVIGVPTSVGYGAHFQGLAPLLTMLNSCASGVSVVNIDNGFGAAMCAYRILQPLQERSGE
jgi:pyridinium-3,5-biscarboxylic acid mononucleotide synthase